jgi:hypothetical protein
MTMVRNWVRFSPFLAFVALAIAVATLVFGLWPKQKITKANFNKIQIGVPQGELCRLLGNPEFDAVELGTVRDAKNYATNDYYKRDQLLGMGYQDFRHQQWISSEISINVISDLNGDVVCRYSGPGREQDWREFLRSLVFW